MDEKPLQDYFKVLNEESDDFWKIFHYASIYLSLQKLYTLGSNNPVFQDSFSNFYRFRGITAGDKKEFFKVMGKYRPSSKDNLSNEDKKTMLSDFVTNLEKKLKSEQYSFASKALHTVRPTEFWIIDSQIEYFRKECKLPDPKQDYAEFCKEMDILLEKFEVNLNDLRGKLTSHGLSNASEETLSDLKLLDFVAWSLGAQIKEKKRQKKAGKN